MLQPVSVAVSIASLTQATQSAADVPSHTPVAHIVPAGSGGLLQTLPVHASLVHALASLQLSALKH